MIENKNVTIINSIQNILDACLHEMRNFGAVEVCHVYREQNKVADLLAKHSLLHEFGLMIYERPPGSLLETIKDDKAGVSWPRRIPIL